MYNSKNKAIIEQRNVIGRACACARWFGGLIQLVWGRGRF